MYGSESLNRGGALSTYQGRSVADRIREEQMRRSVIDRLLLPSIVGLTTVLAVLILWQRLLTEQRAKIQAATKAQASFVKNKMESELNARILLLDRLAPRWQVRVQPGDEDKESDAALMMSGYGPYQAIEWVDSTFHVRRVAPERGNETEVGTDLGSDPRRDLTGLI